MKNKILEKKAIKWCNTYYECDDYIILNCSKEETNESYDILIDKDDFEMVSQGQWYVFNPRKNNNLKNIYNIIWSKYEDNKSKNYLLHQLILNTKYKQNVVVDHINNNRFDNRRKNLRIVNSQINRLNQEPKKLGKNKLIDGKQGYNYDKKTKKYLTRITINGKMINIGRYKTELEAETIYLKASIIIGNDKISTYIHTRILELNITLTNEEIKSNKYLYKVYCIYNNIEIPKQLNGKLNLEYEKNIDIIDKLFKNGCSWNYIANYLMDNNLQEKANAETVKKYYLKYLKDNNYSDDYINDIKK